MEPGPLIDQPSIDALTTKLRSFDTQLTVGEREALLAVFALARMSLERLETDGDEVAGFAISSATFDRSNGLPSVGSAFESAFGGSSVLAGMSINENGLNEKKQKKKPHHR